MASTTTHATPFDRASQTFARARELAERIEGFADRAVGATPRPVADQAVPANGGALGRLEEQAAETLASIQRAEDVLRGLFARFGFDEVQDLTAAQGMANRFGTLGSKIGP